MHRARARRSADWLIDVALVVAGIVLAAALGVAPFVALVRL
jgi:hypothetical protein